MQVTKLIEDAAANIISGSLASNGINGWEIHKGLQANKISFPCIKIICGKWIPDYPENNIGVGRTTLDLITCAIKLNTSSSLLENISDICFDPFLQDNIAGVLASNTTNLMVSKVIDRGYTPATLDDGWVITQQFEIVCGRTA